MVTNKGHTAGYFTTIDEVARAQVPYFLTREDITAYVAPSSAAERPPVAAAHKATGNYDKSTIRGGTGTKK